MSEVALIPEHLYVHVPLCRSKCDYCDFYSVACSEAPADAIDASSQLAAQALAWLERDLAPRPLRSLYVGGGTPTVLGYELALLVETLVRRFGLTLDAEVTVEANPESLDGELAQVLADVGVTRVSLGVQSFDDAELLLLGRCHDAAMAREAARSAIRAGLTLSVDLMCGLPRQAMETWRATLRETVATGASHASVYPLSLEAGTPLAASVLVGDIDEPDPDSAAEMMEAAARILSAEGLRRYEVSNYARTGCQSVHNTAYWTGREYMGVGPGAHGMLSASTARAAGIVVPEGGETARVRYAVACDFEAGLVAMPRIDVEMLNEVEAAREDAMLGLRLAEGIDDALVRRAGVRDSLESLRDDGLVWYDDGRWCTTDRGWLLGNEVFGRVWGGGV